MQEPIHETIADQTKYVYFRVTGVKRKVDPNENPKDNWNSMLPSFHKAKEFWVILRGNFSVWLNGKKMELCAGDILFIDSYKTHYYSQAPNSSKIVLVYDANFLSNVIGEDKNFPTVIKNQRLFNEFVQLATNVQDEWDDMSTENKIGFTYKMLGLVAQHVDPIEVVKDCKTDSFAKRIVEYLYNHYAEDVTIKTLAAEFGYTEGYFSELFNKVMGKSLREYLNRLRIAVADNIKIDNPSMSLREVSERVGYNSWVTFYRAYNKYSNTKTNDQEIE